MSDNPIGGLNCAELNICIKCQRNMGSDSAPLYHVTAIQSVVFLLLFLFNKLFSCKRDWNCFLSLVYKYKCLAYELNYCLFVKLLQSCLNNLLYLYTYLSYRYLFKHIVTKQNPILHQFSMSTVFLYLKLWRLVFTHTSFEFTQSNS